jgi:NAD(P)-dependent dehydrogenase (short-subunit alcohol dehydrogenase family)
VELLYRKRHSRASESPVRLRFKSADVYSYFAMSDLLHKIVLITGGSGGLGQAFAQAFAAEGSRVIIAARDREKLQRAVEKMGGNGVQILAFPCDISDRNQVSALAQEVRSRWGDVQVLVNNAGIAQAVSFSDMPDELWDDMQKINLTGAYNCCKVFLPAMLRAKWGRIINIASTAAKVGFSHVTAYTASKHGLLGLTRSLALETARAGVTVNAVCPGYVDDERTHENAKIMAEKTGKSVGDVLKLYASSAPQNRLIAPEEVAQLAVFLASEQLSGMTGQAINVDGGAVMT